MVVASRVAPSHWEPMQAWLRPAGAPAGSRAASCGAWGRHPSADAAIVAHAAPHTRSVGMVHFEVQSFIHALCYCSLYSSEEQRRRWRSAVLAVPHYARSSPYARATAEHLLHATGRHRQRNIHLSGPNAYARDRHVIITTVESWSASSWCESVGQPRARDRPRRARVPLASCGTAGAWLQGVTWPSVAGTTACLNVVRVRVCCVVWTKVSSSCEHSIHGIPRASLAMILRKCSARLPWPRFSL